MYSLSCGQTTVQVQVTYTAVTATSAATSTPSVTLTASSTTAVAGTNITLTWSSQYADSCTGSGGMNGDGWNGSHVLSGTMTITEASAGAVTYTMTCSGAPPAATAHVTVTYGAPAGTASSQSAAGTNSSSSGGGGAFDAFWLLLLSLPLAVRVFYSSRNPTVTGMRAARTAGNRPPMNPIANAHFSPFHSNKGETLKANTTWLKFEPRVDAV
jgi:hypothetical protein